jgi:hypothetical protein
VPYRYRSYLMMVRIVSELWILDTGRLPVGRGVVVGKGRSVTDEGTNRDYRKAVTYRMGLIY